MELSESELLGFLSTSLCLECLMLSYIRLVSDTWASLVDQVRDQCQLTIFRLTHVRGCGQEKLRLARFMSNHPGVDSLFLGTPNGENPLIHEATGRCDMCNTRGDWRCPKHGRTEGTWDQGLDKINRHDTCC